VGRWQRLVLFERLSSVLYISVIMLLISCYVRVLSVRAGWCKETDWFPSNADDAGPGVLLTHVTQVT